jgi:hypothetical protein
MPELLDHSNILEDYHLEMVRVITDSQKPYCVEESESDCTKYNVLIGCFTIRK